MGQLIRIRIIESKAKDWHWLADLAAHQTDYTAGVKAGAEKCADRYIAAKVHSNALVEFVPHRFGPTVNAGGVAQPVSLQRCRVPIAVERDLTVLVKQE